MAETSSKPEKKTGTKRIPKLKTADEASLNSSQRAETAEARMNSLDTPRLIPSPQPPIKPISALLCVPAYNEEKEIGPFIIKSKQYFDRILVCDDGSKDLMGEVAAGLGATVIRNETSVGRIAALRILLERSLELDPEMIMVMDVDPQLLPSQISKIISPIKLREADVVFGAQPGIVNVGEDDLRSIFMAFSQKSLKAFLSAPPEVLGSHSRIAGVASSSGLNLVEVPIERQAEPFKLDQLETQMREAAPPTLITQQSSTMEKAEDKGMVRSLVKAVSTRPNLFFGTPGILFLAIGIFAGAYLLTTFLNLQYLSLPAAFIMIIGVISGLFLLMTSIILAAFSYLINNS
jgi:hypothetical protein